LTPVPQIKKKPGTLDQVPGFFYLITTEFQPEKNGLNMMFELDKHVVGANLFAKKNYLSTSNV